MTKRKTTLSLIAIGAVTILILIVVGVVRILINSWLDIPEPPPFRIVSSSPQQTYAITVERKQRKPTREDWTSWKIYLSYTSQGQRILNEVVVAAGDSSTGPYYKENPQLNWIRENTFRLSDIASSPESKSDVLLIRNDSANTLSYLIVSGGSGEWFYILNLAPQASLKLNALPQQWGRDFPSSIWVSADGQFINGGKVSDGKDFRIPSYTEGPGYYCFSVKEDGITIVSRDFEGRSPADFTSEEEKQIEEYRKKVEAGQTTPADKKTIDEIYSNRAEIITPRSPDCGATNAVSFRR
jgi:hypothetical protein